MRFFASPRMTKWEKEASFTLNEKIPVRDFPTGKTEAGILDNATKESV